MPVAAGPPPLIPAGMEEAPQQPNAAALTIIQRIEERRKREKAWRDKKTLFVTHDHNECSQDNFQR